MSFSDRQSRIQQAVVPRDPARQQRIRRRELAAAIFLFVTLLGQLVIRLELIEKRYELGELRAEALKRDSELRQLRFQYAELTRPSISELRAEVDLSMTPTTPQQLRKIYIVAN